ncbi:GTPase, G3E family [Lachnospiraceae bacterium]|nr:GTPase, G3E family [Lachnospiraceae bacterium]
MPVIDLITGFLGSGKTTFIRKYAQYLMDKGMRIGILENDYGAVNVDMTLLSDLRSDKCELEMVSGGCDYDCHRRRFKSKLISMGMSGYDRIIVEPSGVFDTDEFFDILHEDPIDSWYRIGSVLTIVDAGIPDEMSEEAEYFFMAQAANAGKIVLSHVDTNPGQEQKIADHLNRVMEQFKCKRRFKPENLFAKEIDSITTEDFDKLSRVEYVGADHVKITTMDDNGFQSLFYMNVIMEEEDFREKIRRLFQDQDAGHVLRVKGYLQTPEEKWYELNITKETEIIKEVESGQAILIVIGEELNKEKVYSYFEGATTV